MSAKAQQPSSIQILPYPSGGLAQGGVIGGSGISGGVIGPGITNGRQPNMPAAVMTCAADGTVVSTTGEPVVRAHVSAFGMGAEASATSDAQGRWTMTGIPCGPVRFSAQKNGFLLPGSGMGAARMPAPVTVADGSPAHNVKVELLPAGVITGKVVDENGDPVPSVQISLIASGVQEGKRRWMPRGGGMTNDLGEYRLFGLMPGKVVVCARSNMMPNMGRQSSTVYPESCYPSSPEGPAASTIDLVGGREQKVDFTLAATRGVTIRGTVSGVASGRGVGLQLRKRDSSAMVGMIHTGVRFLPDGSFEIAGVTPGAYYLTANLWEQQNHLFAEVPVDVGSSDVEGVRVALGPGFSITGTVRIESSSGGQPSDSYTPGFARAGVGGPVPPNGGPANLMLRPMEGSVFGMTQVKWSDDKKSFTFSDVSPGKYRLDAFASPPFYVKSARLGDQDLLNGEILLQQSAGPIDIVLADDTGTVQGSLKDAAGNVATGQLVLLPSSGARPVFGFAQQDGNFNIVNVPPGSYRLFAWTNPNEAAYGEPEWMRQHSGEGVDLTVSPKQTAKADATQSVLP